MNLTTVKLPDGRWKGFLEHKDWVYTAESGNMEWVVIELSRVGREIYMEENGIRRNPNHGRKTERLKPERQINFLVKDKRRGK